MNTYLRLIKFIRPYSGVLITAMILMLLSSVLGNGVPLMAAIPLFDRIFSGEELVLSAELPALFSRLEDTINSMPKLKLMYLLSGIILGSFLLKAVITYCQTYLMTALGQKVVRDIRKTLYDKFTCLSLNFYSKQNTGKLISRVIYDTTIIQDSVAEGLTNLIFQSFQLIICLTTVMIVRHFFAIPWWLLLGACVLPTLIYPLVRIGRKLRALSKEGQESMGELTSALSETFSGIRVVQAYSMERYELSRFESAVNRFYRIFMKSKKRAIAISPMSEFVGIVCSSIVLLSGGHLVLNHGLSPGAFLSFFGALSLCIRPVNRLSRVHAVNQQALAAATRIFDIIDTPVTIQESPGAEELPPFSREISLKRIGFKYEEAPVLKNIDLTIRKGEVVALVGPSGVGKSTLVNLILRFYDPTDGIVEIDGHDIRRVTLASLRGQIGVVDQETMLFNDTVRDNIAYGRPGMSMEKIEEAAGIANAHNFIVNLPEGYRTIVGDRGFRLSGGEKQRIAIARAVLKDPPILILDEATSQLDSESEMLVREAVGRLMKDRTVVMIAHRLATVRHATKIVVLEQGRIAEIGTHECLLAGSGLYRKICEMQLNP